jgi:hypothetical protein
MRPGCPARALIAGAVLLFATSCVSRRVEDAASSSPAPENASVATQLVIDQFLRAANSNDLDTMARLFGTRDGSVLNRDRKSDVDKQMFAVASILRHDSYTIKRSEPVPGRRDEATRVVVAMKFGQRTVDVPWTLVWTKDRTWLVEQIAIEEITNR